MSEAEKHWSETIRCEHVEKDRKARVRCKSHATYAVPIVDWMTETHFWCADHLLVEVRRHVLGASRSLEDYDDLLIKQGPQS